MVQIITAPPPPFIPQQQERRPRSQFNIGGRQNDDALLFALLQFMSNQQQAQTAQEFRERQFGLEKSLGERQIEESKRAEREARRIRLVTESQARFSRQFGEKTANADVAFRKSARKEVQRGIDSLKSFTAPARVVQRDLRRSPHGEAATVAFQNFTQRLRDSVEELVGQETNPLVKSGIATRFGEILGSLQQTAGDVGNRDLFGLTDEIAFSSQGFLRFVGMQDRFIEDALSQRQAALLRDKNLRLEEIQQALSSFGDPDAPISEARARQIVGDVNRRPIELPGLDQLAFAEPSRPFRPVGDVPGGKGLGQELLEIPGEFAGAVSRGVGGTPGIQPGVPAVPSLDTNSLLLGSMLATGQQMGLIPGESPARFKPDQQPTPFTTPPPLDLGIDIQGPSATSAFSPVQSVPLRQGVLPPTDPFGPPTIPGFRGFGGF